MSRVRFLSQSYLNGFRFAGIKDMCRYLSACRLGQMMVLRSMGAELSDLPLSGEGRSSSSSVGGALCRGCQWGSLLLQVIVSLFYLGLLWPWPDSQGPCPSLIFCFCDKMSKSNLGEKGFLSDYSLRSFVKGSQGRNLEARTEAETIEENCLLVCSAQLARFALLYNPGLPVMVVPHREG